MGLIDIFGGNPIAKVLDFFRLHNYWDYSIKDVSEATGLSYRTLQFLMPEMIKKDFIVYTRTEGKAKLYKFNSDAEIAKKLNDFARDIDFEMAKMKSVKKVIVCR